MESYANFITKDLEKYLKPNSVMPFEMIDELQKRQEVIKDHISLLINKKESIGTVLWESFFANDLKHLNKKNADIELIFEQLDLGKISVAESNNKVV